MTCKNETLHVVYVLEASVVVFAKNPRKEISTEVAQKTIRIMRPTPPKGEQMKTANNGTTWI